eukprot:PITA_34916
MNLLREYQDLFPTKFLDLKGILGDLGVMKINLKPNVKAMKQRPYQLNLKYKEKVHKEQDKMLEARIIEPVDEFDWVFDKWVIEFVGQIQPPGKKTVVWYIITVTEYLGRWEEAQPVKDGSTAIVAKFLFEYALTRFGCPNLLMSDRATHFLSETIVVMLEEFQVYHQKCMPYHPQENGTIEAFNKILENALTKVCNA